MLNKAIVQDSDQTAQTFPVVRFTLLAQYRVIIKQTTHACNNQTGQSFSGINFTSPGHVGQSVGHLTSKSGVLGSIPGLATYFRFSFR